MPWGKIKKAVHTSFDNPIMSDTDDCDIDDCDIDDCDIDDCDVLPDDFGKKENFVTTKKASDYSQKTYIKLLNSWIKKITPSKNTIKEHCKNKNDGLGYYIVFGGKKSTTDKVDMIVHKHYTGIGEGILYMRNIPFSFDILPPGKIVDVENQKISYDYIVNRIMHTNKKVLGKRPIIYEKIFKGVQRQFVVYLTK